MARPRVLATVVAAKSAKPGQDFFPLTVNYQEKAFAAGRIPGGYFKREGRPSERETLVSRLIDRPIRPLFAEGYRNETQVVVTVLSHDLENDPDIAGHGRRFRRPDDFRHSLHGPDRRRPRRPSSTANSSVNPTVDEAEELPSSTSSSPAPPTPC